MSQARDQMIKSFAGLAWQKRMLFDSSVQCTK